MRSLVALATSLAVAGTGCSWIGVSELRPQPGSAHAQRYCTQSYFLPAVDSVFAAGWLTALTAGVVERVDNTDTTLVETPLLLGAAAAAVTYTASAVYGYRAVHACNATD